MQGKGEGMFVVMTGEYCTGNGMKGGYIVEESTM